MASEAQKKLTPKFIAAVCKRVRAGQAPDRACVAEGVSSRMFRNWRASAKEGSPLHVHLFSEMEKAAAEGEYSDIETTRRAAQPHHVEQKCTNCGEPYEIDIASIEQAHKIQISSANIALERLARRNPRDWAQNAKITIETEHERFLDLIQEVLGDDAYERVMSEYSARATAIPPIDKSSRVLEGVPDTEPVH